MNDGQPLSVRAILVFLASVIAFWMLATTTAVQLLAPQRNADLSHFDALIVLGSPTESDGRISGQQQDAIEEAVREFKKGIATHVIFTGGAAHNQFIEAARMADAARLAGIPASSIVIEAHAMNTIQNACYSTRIMREHGWRSAEVLTISVHLARTGLIFSQTNILWQERRIPRNHMSPFKVDILQVLEGLKTVRYLLCSRWRPQSC